MRVAIGILVLIFLLSGAVFAQHFEPVDPTGLPYSCLIVRATINGEDLEVDDEIGVFDADLCVGSGTILEETVIDSLHPFSILAWQGDEANGLPGFTPGNVILYRIWSNAGGFEAEAEGEVVPDPNGAGGDGTFGNGPYAWMAISATTDAGTIDGIVTNCLDELMENVLVTLDTDPDNPVTTDANGAFTIEGVEPGPHLLTYEHPEYYPAEQTVQVNPNEVADGNLTLTYPDAMVNTPQGTTLTVFGATMVGDLLLQLEGTGCDNLSWNTTVNVIDQPGQTWLTLDPATGTLAPDGTVDLGLHADINGDPGFVPEDGMDIAAEIVFGSDSLWTNPPTQPITVHLTLTGPIQGTVRECTEAGIPIEGVSVYLQPDLVTPVATTDADGYYEVDVPAGFNDLHFEHPDYYPVDVEQVPSPGDGSAVMQTAGAAVTLPDGNNIDVLGVSMVGEITLQMESTGCHPLNWNTTITTDQGDGWLTLDDDRGTLGSDETITLTLTADLNGDPGFVPEDGMVINGQIQFGTNDLWPDPPLLGVTVTLNLAGVISGTVTECNDGGPIEGVQVYEIGTVDIIAVTDIDGHYSANLVNGETYDLGFSHPTHYNAIVEDIIAPDQADVVMYYPDVDVEETPRLVINGNDYTGSAEIEVFSTGCANLTWTEASIDPTQPWLSIDPPSGSIPGGSSAILTLHADRTDTVFTPGHEDSIAVTLTFNNDPVDEYLANPPNFSASIIYDIDTEIQGNVTECTNEGGPIEGVSIYLDDLEDPSAITDANGYFAVSGLPVGYFYSLHFRDTGHFPADVDRILVNEQVPVVIDTVNMTYADAEASTDSLFIVVEIQNFFSDSLGHSEFSIESTGCVPLNWEAATVNEEDTWVHLTPSSGRLDIGETEQIEILIDLTDPGDIVLEHELLLESQVALAAEYWDDAPLINLYVFCVDSTQYPHYGSVDGYVYEEDSDPRIFIEGASVTIDTSTVLTDENGYYSIPQVLVDNNVPVTVSAENYLTRDDITIHVREGANQYDFALVPEVGVRENDLGAVTEYALVQNFPNPFNPTTQIRFDLVEPQTVHLSVYNLVGQEVVTLAEGEFAAGHHFVTFNAAGLPTGIYFYGIRTEAFTDMRKMLLVK